MSIDQVGARAALISRQYIVYDFLFNEFLFVPRVQLFIGVFGLSQNITEDGYLGEAQTGTHIVQDAPYS